MGRRRADENGAAASGLAALSWPGQVPQNQSSPGAPGPSAQALLSLGRMGALGTGPGGSQLGRGSSGLWWAMVLTSFSHKVPVLRLSAALGAAVLGGMSPGCGVRAGSGEASFLLKRVAEWGQVSGDVGRRLPHRTCSPHCPGPACRRRG